MIANEQALQELLKLRRAWADLFLSGSREEQMEAQILDVHHPVPALNALVTEILNECIEGLRIQVARLNLDDDDATEYAFDVFGRLARATAIRMFRVGQSLAETMPYANMTKCSCQTVEETDWQQLTNLLADATLAFVNTLSGDGWTIVGWDPNKKPERYKEGS